MSSEIADTLNTGSHLENLTRTLLYEGYALYPYHRSAIKNQKPVPFGVVFPLEYNAFNVHAHSEMKTQCIITGNDDLLINISIRFLHLKQIKLLEQARYQEPVNEDFLPVYHLSLNGKSFNAGWQTIERRITTGDMRISQLVTNGKTIRIEFDETDDSTFIYDENGNTAAKQVSSIAGIKGTVIIAAVAIEGMRSSFQVTIGLTNTTPVKNAKAVTRDEVLCQSFLSTHAILNTANGKFISHQDAGENWQKIISGCHNINTWPILVDENNTTLLSSPIILPDYPQINPQSHGDLFDSTEIEEALLLHMSVLSDEEKNRIAESDEKLRAMLDKLGQVTPGDLTRFHSSLKHDVQNQFKVNKK